MKKNRPKIVYKAASAGFTYSYIMTLSAPYNIGVVSAVPFTVIEEYGPPLFQRGLLHIYYDSLELHVMIVHLHAHVSTLREDEARAIVGIYDTIASHHQVVVMGDFNTLSPWDYK